MCFFSSAVSKDGQAAPRTGMFLVVHPTQVHKYCDVTRLRYEVQVPIPSQRCYFSVWSSYHTHYTPHRLSVAFLIMGMFNGAVPCECSKPM
jgi:hypothetical protein